MGIRIYSALSGERSIINANKNRYLFMVLFERVKGIRVVFLKYTIA